jgi:methyl-accepting chemotaxis protein-1 (serine sensor receptor)
MSLWNRWSVKTRLIIGYALLCFGMAVIVATSLVALNAGKADFEYQVTKLNLLQKLSNDVLDASHRRAIQARNMVITDTPARLESSHKKVVQAHTEMQERLKALAEAMRSTPNLPAQAISEYEAIQKTESQYGPVALRIVEQALKGQREEAIRGINNDCLPLLEQLEADISRLIKGIEKISANNVVASKAHFDSLLATLLALGLAILVIAAVMGTTTTRSITRPLEQARAATLAFASGDLSHPLNLQGNDEIAQVANALESMRQNLTRLVSMVRQGSETVSDASAEIATGNQDLSNRTESQASALEETAAAMEQLNATLHQNSDNAGSASEMARNAASIASAGGTTVSEVVETMHGLSESSRRISDITGIIDGIAFQTNILALNAAVEAARAGEQGRGFAVVASEVRSLASRSASAAKEIKQLIQDNVHRIERGGTLADQAGETMQRVVQSISGLNTLMSDISMATREQSDGVAQIDQAVQQLDQTTQQNAALVEEMAAAAASLRSQAKDLVQAVSVFKVNPHDMESLPMAQGMRPALALQ